MIGQVRLQKKIRNTVSPFTIIVGPKGSGKKTLINEVKPGIYVKDVKIDTIRSMIQTANKVKETTFILCDADNMSVPAQNALLKVVEECPNNNKFIMTVEDENNVLSTIRSRAVIFHMEPYTSLEILDYARKFTKNSEELSIINDLCSIPGEVDLLLSYNVNEFYGFVEKVVDHIDTVSDANSFKLTTNIKTKASGTGYDIALFWKAFCRVCFVRWENDKKYIDGVKITGFYLTKLRNKTLSRQMMLDNWVMCIREAWDNGFVYS